MTLVKKAHCILCRFLCGHTPSDPTDLPFKVREASHAVANEATKVIAASQRVSREAEALAKLVEAAQHRGRK